MFSHGTGLTPWQECQEMALIHCNFVSDTCGGKSMHELTGSKVLELEALLWKIVKDKIKMSSDVGELD